MNVLDLDTPDATPDGNRLAPAPHGTTTTVARSTMVAAFRRMHAAIGVAERDGPAQSNWQVLAHRGFRWYFAGSVASNFGTWVQNTAQVVLAYELTHSVFWVGLVSLAQFSGPLLLGPWAGVMTHRFGSWRTLIVTQCASMIIAATLAALQFSQALTIAWLFYGALAIGLAFTFALPALSVTVAALVPPDPVETRRALALDSVSYNLGRALAPVLSVLVIRTLGFGWAFALNGVSFGVFTAVLLRLRPRATPHEFVRSRIVNGFRIARDDRRILILLLMVAAVTVAADPILVLGPALARGFGASAASSGIFIAALGAGNVIGSFRRTRRVPSMRNAAVTLGILSLAIMVFVLAPWIWVSIMAAFVAGTACLVVGATTRTLLLRDAGQGRQAAVMAAWAVAWAGSKPIASFTDGTLAGLIGVHAAGVLLALPALVPMLALVMFPGYVRRLGRAVVSG